MPIDRYPAVYYIAGNNTANPEANQMTILNRTKSPRDRYRLMSGPQGNAGYPPDSPNHRYHVVSGVDRGNGYQGYYSVTYFLNECGWGPKEAKAALRRLLGIKSEG